MLVHVTLQYYIVHSAADVATMAPQTRARTLSNPPCSKRLFGSIAGTMPSVSPIIIPYLQRDLNTTLRTRCTARKGRQEVCDVVPRMPVKTSAQPLLVEEMSNKTN
jgi:hypothetical protein